MPQISKARTNAYRRFAIPLLILLLGSLTILFHLGTAGLFETSEGRYASVGRAMLDSGDWLVPVHNGLRHLTKPPVTYWASALGMKLFGINELGARFFLAPAAGLTALGCFYIGLALFNMQTAVLSALILICSLFFQVQFRGLTTDPFLTMYETMMVLGFIRFLQTHSTRKQKRWEIFFWAMAALAMLTKGPPGLLPLAGLIPGALSCGYKNHLKTLFKSAIGWTIFVILGMGWYLYLAVTIPGLLQYFLVDETLNRVASSQHHRSAPFYLYLLLLPAGIFPWSGFFFRSLRNARAYVENSNEIRLLFWWLFVPLAIFTLSRSKLAAYALPLLVPIALLAGAGLVDLLSRLPERLADFRFHLRVTGSILLLLGLALFIFSLSGQLAAPSLNFSLKFCGIVWVFIAIFLLGQSCYTNRVLILALLAFTAPSLMFFSMPVIRGNEQLQPGKFLPSQWLLLKRIANLPPEQQIINIEEMIEGWYFYTGRYPITWNVKRVTRFDEKKAQELVLSGNEQLQKSVTPNSMLVLRHNDLARVSEILDYELRTVATEGKWLVCLPERRFKGQ